MITALYSVPQEMLHNGNPMWKYVYKLNKLIINLFYPITQIGNARVGIDKNSDVIVSLTTYPARINIVWITVSTLLNQSYKPAKVLLYLSWEQFPNGLEGLPKKLLKLQERGLEIVFVEDDLKPHKKYYYAFKEYKDFMVITADDDIFYPENHVELLVKAARKFPDAVICNRSHRIGFVNADGNEYLPYNSWEDDKTESPEMLTLPVGCNGVLYKPSQFCDEVFNINNIKECSLYTDDLWLKAMEVKSSIKAYNCSYEPLVYFDVLSSKKTGLFNTNASSGANRNDDAWKKIIDKYPEVTEGLI